MTPTRRPKLSYRDGRTAIYQTQADPKEPLWRDLIAGMVFFFALLVFTAVLLVGGLMVFG